jgi:hypothetical protein
VASAFGHEGVAAALLDNARGATTLEAAAKDSNTPLHAAASEGRREVVVLLLQRGANPRLLNISGHTPLLLASDHGHVGAAAALLDDARGATTLETPNKESNTPLHIAAYEGHVTVAALLVQRGANISLKTRGGRTAIQLAARRGHRDVVRLLVEAMRGPAVVQPTSTTQPSQPARLQQVQDHTPSPLQQQDQDQGSAAETPSASCPKTAGTSSHAAPEASGTSSDAPAPGHVGGSGECIKRCGQCGAEGVKGQDTSIQKCDGCRTLYYCKTGPCQRLAWRGGHKQQCPLLREAWQQARAGRGVPSGAAPPTTS